MRAIRASASRLPASYARSLAFGAFRACAFGARFFFAFAMFRLP
jgi:hypothetical protein